MKPTLIILNGQQSGKRFMVSGNTRYILGRDKKADVCLPEKKISRRHACVQWDETKDQLTIEDLGSLNGTFVNGNPVSEATTIADKDRIQIGSFVLQVTYPTDLELEEVEEGEASSLEVVEAEVANDTTPDPPFADLSDNQYSDRFYEEEENEVDVETGGRLLSGRLDQLSIPDILQMLSTTKKTGRLVISKKKMLFPPHPGAKPTRKYASFFIQDGALIAVIYGSLRNEKAFYELLSWHEGYFALFPYSDFQFKNPMDVPIEALLLDGIRRLDEERSGITKLKANDKFDVKPDEPLTQLNDKELKVFQLAWKHKKVSIIWDKSQYDQKTTNETIQNLIRKGFLIKK